LVENELYKKFPPAEAEEKYREIVKTYEKLANDVPSIGGKANSMSKNFYGALAVFTYYECMKINPLPVLEGITIYPVGCSRCFQPCNRHVPFF